MSMCAIDVWDATTFDPLLLRKLEKHVDLIGNYLSTSRRQWLEREVSDHRSPYPENAFGFAYSTLRDAIGDMMSERTVRAWHYTRLTDEEVSRLLVDGIYLSTLESIRGRFDQQVATGRISMADADALFAASPFQGDQRGARVGKFWMTSHPHEIDDSGVEPLLGHWGGESAYFWLQDEHLRDRLTRIGTPHVIEVAVPLSMTRQAHSAGEAVLATFARTIGCKPDKHAFDLYTTGDLGPDHVRAVHSEGEYNFTMMGRGFPAGYRDPTIGEFDGLMAELEAIRRGV